MGLKTRFSGLYEWAYELFVLNLGWLYVLYVHLPMGFLRRRLKESRDWLMLKLALAKKGHQRKVANVQRQVRRWHKLGCPQKKMCTSAGMDQCQRMCFSRPNYKNALYKIKLDALGDIIEINTTEKFVRVEPYVTIDQLQRALLPIGFTLPVTPELGDLTIGGLIQGCGIGSGSGKFGLFQHICLAYEIVTATGELITAEKDGEHQSLFFGIPWSLGTLGFLVSATIQIRPSSPFVRLVYQPCLSPKELSGRMQEEIHPKAGNDFVEAIQFDKDRAVLLCGKFIDQVPKNDQRAMNPIGKWHKPFFYQHARRTMEKGTTRIEYIPTADYFRRHWRSLFWEIRHMLPFAGLFPFRWLLGWLLPPSFPTSTRVKRIYAHRHVLQNLLVPAKNLPETLATLDQELKIYPIWLCPFTLPAQPGLLRNRYGLRTVYVNCGIYGVPKGEVWAAQGAKGIGERLRRVEEHTRNAQGFQMLCADSHQNAAEFWEMFDATLYDWLRARYECKAALPNVYEKLCMANRN